MEEVTNQNPATPNNSSKNFLIPAAVIVIAAIAIFAFLANQPSTENQIVDQQVPTSVVSEEQAEAGDKMEKIEQNDSGYADGIYEADGNYVSPGGPRDIGIKITLEDGVVTAAEFEGRATDATSKRFQGEFRDNFKSQVVGKNIDDLDIKKVAGSSLSPIGFMDALEKIKVEAEA